jgi:DNA-binding response OmpR family regulator
MGDAPRILIIDDEPNVRLMFRTTLEAAGHVVAEADTGEKGLMRLQEFPADLVLLDLQMPEMDGMEVLRRLRAARSTVPVVIVTAHGSVPNAVQALKLGAIDFLSKPLSPDALRRVVAEVVARHASARTEPAAAPARPAARSDLFAESLRQAKRALNRCEFDQADFYLRQAIVCDDRSVEARDLWVVLQKARHEDEQTPFRALRSLFPVGRPRAADSRDPSRGSTP